jgi:hypothetical protein
MNIFFQRSKETTLSIRSLRYRDGSLGTRRRRCLLDLVQNHPRLEEITFELHKTADGPLLEILAERMPALTRLTLLNHALESAVTPSHFFANIAPRLQLLSLENLNVPWSSPALSGLTSLSLHYTNRHIPSVPHQSFNTFFSALASMPELTELSLKYALPSTALPHSQTTTVIQLPLLDTLRLSGTCDQCRIAVQGIQIPMSARVELAVTSGVDEPTFRGLCEGLRSSWLCGSPNLNPREEGRRLHWERIQLDWYRDSRGISARAGSIPDLEEFQLTVDEDWTPPLQALLMGLLPIRDTKDFFLQYHTFPPAMVQATLPSLSTIKDVIVADTRCAVGIVSALLSAEQRTEGTVQLPQLTGLRLSCVCFVPGSSTEEALGLQDLEEWLRFRSASTAGIKRLELSSCYPLTPNDAERLQHSIGDGGSVNWDGFGEPRLVLSLRPISYD